jgi:hypothetical protein
LFPHPVEGYVDWTYSRAYVVSKVKQSDGMPSQCVVYRHDSDIAKFNDSKNGQALLLKKLEADGPMQVRLLPIGASKRKAKSRYSRKYAKRPSGSTGERTRLPAVDGVVARGAAARYALAKRSGALE